jgi:hypothetical protein
MFQNKIIGQLQTIAQQMYGVDKLEKLQNINKTPLFLTWPSDRYGKLCNFAILSYRNWSDLLMITLPCPEASHTDPPCPSHKCRDITLIITDLCKQF